MFTISRLTGSIYLYGRNLYIGHFECTYRNRNCSAGAWGFTWSNGSHINNYNRYAHAYSDRTQYDN